MQSSSLWAAILISLLVHFIFLLTFLGRPGMPSGPAHPQGMIAVSFIKGIVNEARAESAPLPELTEKDPDLLEPQEQLEKEIPQVQEETGQDDHENPSELVEDNTDGQPGDRSLLSGNPSGVNDTTFDNPMGFAFPWGYNDSSEQPKCGDETDATCALCNEPKYPFQALRRRIEGVVILNVEILKDGKVGDVYVEESSGFPILDNAALEAVKAWQFYPASSCGEPTIQRLKVPVRFELE